MIEIDGVRRALEASCTEAGDYISDEYFRAIDMSTSPDRTRGANPQAIASAIRRLNRNLATTEAHIAHAGLVDVYNNVAAQLNEMNEDIGVLLPIEPANTQNLAVSGFFQWS